MDTLYIVVPAYNEAENIEKLVEDWLPIVERHSAGGSSRLVVVNDGSRDDTCRRLCALAERSPQLIPLTKQNGGHGPAVLFGYRYALREGADYVFQTDADGQTNPAEFEMFWRRRRSFDAIFGNRIRRRDGIGRVFTEKVLCLLLMLYFGIRIPDANAPYRLMTRAYLEEFLPRMPEDYVLPNVMLTTYGVYFHKRVKFLPISFRPRQAGRNSMDVKKIFRTGCQALKDFRAFKKGLT